MKDNRKDILRQKLAGHRKTPPDGLWEGICEQMGIVPEPTNKSAVAKRWVWAAAAAVFVLAGFFVFFDNSSDELLSKADNNFQQVSSQQQIEKNVTPSPSCQEDMAKITPSASSHENITRVTSSSSSKAGLGEVPDNIANVPPSPSSQENIADVPLSPTSQEEIADVPPLSSSQEKGGEAHGNNIPITSHSMTVMQHPNKPVPYSQSWSIGINASGGLLAAQTSPMGDKINGLDAFEISENQWASLGSASSNLVAKHHLPIRFGLNVDYRLSPRLAVSSGIHYTYLYSQFSVPQQSILTVNQKLHYLGIPLGMAWQLWSAHNFQLYITGEVMVEKCLNDKPWQFSTHGAAGAEYIFSRKFGFYFEPSLGYYFDDGTHLEHYYKEHPLAPSIEFGLRMHLNE